MKQGTYTILKNELLAPGIWRLVLGGDTQAITAPGQFLNLRLDGHFLRRPISICDWTDTSVTVLYKTLGQGTQELTAYPVGKTLDVLVGLGNGYDTGKSGQRPLLVGGGVGIPPLYRLGKELLGQGKEVTVILGFNRAEEMFYVEKFAALGAKVLVATADGSFGIPGFVTDAIAQAGDYTYVYSCGPTAMLKALDKVITTGGQYSFEERMGCGFGACMGCTCQTKTGAKRICKDGPVLEREEILW
jgi:dihydroorotate dehydrogenase electron transfer subunit